MSPYVAHAKHLFSHHFSYSFKYSKYCNGYTYIPFETEFIIKNRYQIRSYLLLLMILKIVILRPQLLFINYGQLWYIHIKKHLLLEFIFPKCLHSNQWRFLQWFRCSLVCSQSVNKNCNFMEVSWKYSTVDIKRAWLDDHIPILSLFPKLKRDKSGIIHTSYMKYLPEVTLDRSEERPK